MSHTYATPLKLEISPSRLFLKIHVLIYFLATISILSLPWSATIQGACIALLINFGHKTYVSHNRLRLLIWKQENNWELWVSGLMQRLQLQGSSYISPWLAILNFKSEDGARISLVVLNDAVDRHQFRQLRVRLKVEGNKSVRHDKIQI